MTTIARYFILWFIFSAGNLLEKKVCAKEGEKSTSVDSIQTTVTEAMLHKLGVEGLTNEALSLTMKGYQKMRDSLGLEYRYLMIADFSKPSCEKRFFMIDLVDTAIVLHEYVAHGKNSGLLYAREFSNTPHSCQSSLGFYRVSEPYYGQHGLSLRLDGLDRGFNHRARERAIVMHTADYAKPEFIKQNGRMGRSFGCPVLPEESFKKISGSVSGKSLLFIYYPDANYLNSCIWLD